MNSFDETFQKCVDDLVEIRKSEGKQSFDKTFLKMCRLLGVCRSSCDRGRTAAIFTKDNAIISEGYAGSVVGEKECDDIGHEMMSYVDHEGNSSVHCVRTIHAEQNAIINAAKRGVSLSGSTVYVTMSPCWWCARSLVQCGVKRVVAEKPYKKNLEKVKDLFRRHNIELDIISEEFEKYEKE